MANFTRRNLARTHQDTNSEAVDDSERERISGQLGGAYMAHKCLCDNQNADRREAGEDGRSSHRPHFLRFGPYPLAQALVVTLRR